MSRNWWLAIQTRYPKALAECLRYVQRRQASDWRQAIQQLEQLQQYFGEVGVDISTKKGWVTDRSDGGTISGYRYGSIVGSDRLQLERAMLYHSKEQALKDAIYFAFMIREETLAGEKPGLEAV